jgi:hypothetical protein
LVWYPGLLRNEAGKSLFSGVLNAGVFPRSLWDFGEFLHIHAKIPIIGAL